MIGSSSNSGGGGGGGRSGRRGCRQDARHILTMCGDLRGEFCVSVWVFRLLEEKKRRVNKKMLGVRIVVRQAE